MIQPGAISEEYQEGSQCPGSDSEELWRAGSFYISPPSQRKGV